MRIILNASTCFISLAFFLLSCGSKDKKDEAPKPAAPKAAKVDGYIVTPQLLSQDIEVPGSLAAYEEVELHPEVSGRVTGVYFKEGSNVSQGSLLLKIYDGDLLAQLQKMRVQLKVAEQTAERYEALLKINGVSQQEYDLNVLAVNNIKADINIIQTSIAKTSLRAPFSGKMGISTITPGAYISPATIITTLRKVSQLKLEFTVPEKYSTKMKQGKLVHFTLENNATPYPATITATENTIAAETRSLKVIALVSKASAQLIAGSFAKVQIPLGQNDAALMIPSQAIIPQARDKKVIAVRNGIASMETVTTGIRDSASVEITSGLKAGDTVLITGLLATKPGSKVQLNKITKTKQKYQVNISELSLRRPVLAVVLSIVIILFGVIGFKFLGVRDYPAIDPPNISVRTSYPGANADIIESQITEPLEKAINGIAGVKNITSSSSQGSSNINVEFELGNELETAANDVRDKVSQAVRSLPSDLDAPPVVSKADASSDAIISMTVQSNTKNQLEVTEYAINNLLERLQTIPGVSGIQIWGEKKYAMRIWFDVAKLSAYGLTPSDVQVALQNQNVELPSGKIAGNATELSVRTFGKINTEEEFNNIIIKNINGADIKLKDIGEAVLGPENEESVLKESGVPMIALAIVPQPGSNYVAISDEFYVRYNQIKKEVPADIQLDIALDQTKFIKKSISEVKETLVIAIILVVLIIYLFFRDWIIAIRPLIDIPVSLIGAFFIMYVCGFTINVLTLLAIVLATGLVVDDGIVVTENIFKKMEQGMSKWQAAKEGSKEIYFAVIATSITLAIVFLPIIFLQGFVGRLFREFGIVVAGAVLISAFVSLTLTPVLNVKLTRKVHKHSGFYNFTEPFFRGMENGYRKLLNGFMKLRWMAIVLILICFSIIYLIGKGIPSELAPMEDRSQFRLSVTAPEGTSYDYMDNYIDKISRFVADSVPEKTVLISITAPGFTGSGSVNTGFVRAALTDPKDRKRSQQEIVNMLNKNVSKFNEGKIFAIQEQTISVNRRGGLPVQFVVQNINFDKIKDVLPKFLDEANKNPVFQGVDADLKFNKPELRIIIDRLKASDLGISIQDISEALQLALSNRRLGYFTRDGKQYQVIGQVARNDRDDPTDLKGIYVRNAAGQSIALDNLVTMTEESTPPTIYHFNRYKSATISAGLAPGKTIGDGLKVMEEISKKVLDDSFSTSLTGASRDYSESGSNTTFAFVLALILIFLVLAAQFESFIDPLIIMLTVPLAIAGALLSLSLFGQTLNIFSQIGMIMLIGLVTKNGILIVEFANQQQLAGNKKTPAVIDAAVARFRPILMTSLAMSLGALPLALSLGDASTSRIPLGIVIVGGILFSLVLTLFVIPAMYSFLSSKKKKSELDDLEQTSLSV